MGAYLSILETTRPGPLIKGRLIACLRLLGPQYALPANVFFLYSTVEAAPLFGVWMPGVVSIYRVRALLIFRF